MAIKKDTTFKIIGTLCLALCAVFSWYYLRLAAPAAHKPPSREVVPPYVNNTASTNHFSKGVYENFKQSSYQNIVSCIREYQAMIFLGAGLLACAILYLMYVKGFFSSYSTASEYADMAGAGTQVNATEMGQTDSSYTTSHNRVPVLQHLFPCRRKQPNANASPSTTNTAKKDNNKRKQHSKDQPPTHKASMSIVGPISQQNESPESSASQEPAQLDLQYFNDILIPKMEAVLAGTFPLGKATRFDSLSFHSLIATASHVSPDVDRAWQAFRKKQTSMTVDIKKMLPYYKLFLPKIFKKSPLSAQHILLLLDTMIKAFPYLEYITFEKGLFGEVISIKIMFDFSFMKGLKERLSQKGKNTWKNHNLKKITIKSFPDNPIKAFPVMIYISQLTIEGWNVKIEKVNHKSSKKQIALTKIIDVQHNRTAASRDKKDDKHNIKQ